MMAAEIERARAALHCIPADLPRDEWVNVLMAGQSAGLDANELRAWSEQGSSYNARDFADTLRSIKPGKGVGAGTLFHVAAAHGWRMNKPQQRSPSKATIRPVVALPAPRKGMAPADVLARCVPATEQHAYIVRKGAPGVPLESLRVLPADDAFHIGGQPMAGALVVPAYAETGELQSLQLIPPQGKKMNLPGCVMAGASHVVGTPGPGEPVYLVEGIGQAWAIWQATGYAAICCFGWGNVATVARAIRERDNAARLVLCPDVGKEDEADAIAADVGALVALLPAGEPPNFDCNDLAQRDGHDVLRELLESAKEPPKPAPLLLPVDVAGVFTRPSAPPRFVWDGYLPCGVVALLGAHGGTGKSTIALMLCVAVATGRELFGIATEAARVVFVSLEDSGDVVRHRLAHICREWGIAPEQIAQHLTIVDGTANPELYTADRRDDGLTTATHAELRELAQGAGLVVIDNASDAYGGDEIQRRQVRAFIRSLGTMAKENSAAVLLLSHVDKNTSRARKAEAGEGYSGSTAWNNSVRSRLFMSRDESGALLLEHQKSNFGKLREPLRLFWPENGLPQVDAAPTGVVVHIADRVNTQALLRLIAEFAERGEHVTSATTSRTNAAKLLATESTFPKGLKPADVFNLLRRAERAGHLARVIHRGADRKPRECWEVTSKGREFAGLAATAATAATYGVEEVTAPTAEECGDCGDSARGYGGKSAHTQSPQNNPSLEHV
ncbi:MAG: hypothetical protein BGO13_02505, partial [Burkholderiales bacterium 66-5]